MDFSRFAKHYEMLDLPVGASIEEVKHAYRKWVMVWHPDRFPLDSELQREATVRTEEINRAYQEILDHFTEIAEGIRIKREGEAARVRQEAAQRDEQTRARAGREAEAKARAEAEARERTAREQADAERARPEVARREAEELVRREAAERERRESQARATRVWLVSGALLTLLLLILMRLPNAAPQQPTGATPISQMARATSPVGLPPATVPPATATAFEKGTRVVYGPTDGSLNHSSATESMKEAGIRVRDFAAGVRFYNPFDASQGKWEYGIVFSGTEDGNPHTFLSSLAQSGE